MWSIRVEYACDINLRKRWSGSPMMRQRRQTTVDSQSYCNTKSEPKKLSRLRTMTTTCCNYHTNPTPFEIIKKKTNKSNCTPKDIYLLSRSVTKSVTLMRHCLETSPRPCEKKLESSRDSRTWPRNHRTA